MDSALNLANFGRVSGDSSRTLQSTFFIKRQTDMSLRSLLSPALLAASLVASGPALAETLRIGWQQIVEPSRVAQASGAYEHATGAEITWNLFGGGADVIAAVAAGSIDIGYVGSSPLTAAASQGLPIETIYPG